MQENIKISSGKGFKFITNFVIHETREQKIVLEEILIGVINK